MITTLQTFPKGSLTFPFPPHYANISPVTPQTNKSWPVSLILISNTQGHSLYEQLAETTTIPILGQTPARPRPPHNQNFKFWGPPSGFQKLTSGTIQTRNTQTMTLPPLPDPNQAGISMTNMYPAKIPIKWTDPITYYTDGACDKDPDNPEGPNRLGVCFYYSPTDRAYLVRPRGHRETNTILRAELAGIYAALLHASKLAPVPNNITIFSDTQSGVQLISRILFQPRTLSLNKHATMLHAIRLLILERCTLQRHTTLQKVTSHIGVTGNEHADEGATRALLNPHECDYHANNIPSDHFGSLTAWPCMLAETTYTYFSDCTSSVKEYIYKHCPTLTNGIFKDCKTYVHQQAMNTASETAISNHMWSCSSTPFRMIKNILNIRSNTLWTAARALLCKKSYTTKAGSRSDGLCPTCLSSHTPRPADTVGHILGSCTHPDMKASYITRHNKALVLIQRQVHNGSKGGCFTVMDATRETDLPTGVSYTRLPKCFLPNTPENVRLRYRPDIFLVDGLLTHSPDVPDTLNSTWRSTTFHRLRRTCTIHIVELGYCSDKSHTSCISRKQEQHTALIRDLQSHGWNVQYHTIILTSSGYILKPLPPAQPPFQALGIDNKAIKPLLINLHIHSVTSAWRIVCLRRRLENDPKHFHSSAPIPPEPPP